MAYRDDLTALSAHRDALVREVTDTSDALDDASRALDQAHGRGRLPILDNLRVAAPCTADWSRMLATTGDERVRHCGDCKKTVYNLSGLTRAEAEALIVRKNGDLCVRYYQRHDGTILLADCEVGGKRRRRRQRLLAVGAASLAAVGGAAGYLATSKRTPVMGAVTSETAYERPESPIHDLAIEPPPSVVPIPMAPTALPPSDELVMGRISIAPPKPVPTTPTHIKMGKIVLRSDVK